MAEAEFALISLILHIINPKSVPGPTNSGKMSEADRERAIAEAEELLRRAEEANRIASSLAQRTARRHEMREAADKLEEEAHEAEKLRSGRKTATGGDEQDDAPKSSAASARKRAQPTASTTEADANDAEEAKKFKKARPSICKAAEELICPILQGLPIDPVTAEDVSQGRYTYFAAFVTGIGLTCYSIIYLVVIPNVQGQIYEREEIEKYLEGKEGDDDVLSPVTQQRLESKTLHPVIHVRNTIEHLIESGIIEGELADTWKERMSEKKWSEEELKRTKEKAENGNARSMYELGEMYENGNNGLVKDYEEAYKWYKKSSDAGDVMGTALVGECLLCGMGVERNQTEGLIMMAFAAAGGSNYACHLLGEIYFKGLFGSKVNYASAKRWLEKAVADGEGSCEHKHLADESIEGAQGWIAECNAFLEN